jgi:hypothetical protein
LPGYANPTKTAIDKDTCSAGKCSNVQNDAGTRASDWHKIDTTETRFVLGEKENPGALAGASEATFLEKGVKPSGAFSTKMTATASLGVSNV